MCGKQPQLLLLSEASLWSWDLCVWIWLCDCSVVLPGVTSAWGTTAHVSVCHTQFDFGILCEQNILSLNVSVNHMVGVKMGKALEDKYEYI